MTVAQGQLQMGQRARAARWGLPGVPLLPEPNTKSPCRTDRVCQSPASCPPAHSKCHEGLSPPSDILSLEEPGRGKGHTDTLSSFLPNETDGQCESTKRCGTGDSSGSWACLLITSRPQGTKNNTRIKTKRPTISIHSFRGCLWAACSPFFKGRNTKISGSVVCSKSFLPHWLVKAQPRGGQHVQHQPGAPGTAGACSDSPVCPPWPPVGSASLPTEGHVNKWSRV